MAESALAVADAGQLQLVKESPPGPWRVMDLETSAEELVWMLPGQRRMALHGLSALGDVFPLGAQEPRLRSARLHFCSAKPCGHKYDPRILPFQWHGVAIEPLAAGAAAVGIEPSPTTTALSEAGGAGVPTGPSPKRPRPATTTRSEGTAAGVPPGPLDVCEKAPAEAAADSDQDEVLAVAWPRAVDSPCEAGDTGTASAPDAAAPAEQAPKKPFPFGSMARREALRLLFLSEVEKWRWPGFWLPSFALLVFAVSKGRRLHIVMQQERSDFISQSAPELEVFVSPDAEAWVTGCVLVRGDSETETRSLHWPATEAEVMSANHWVILAKFPAEFAFPPHGPCGGARCGGIGEPCFGPLLGACNILGLAPLPTACDGNCGPDVCCAWAGRSRGLAALCALRDELADLAFPLASEDLWLSAFDKCFVPTDAELQACMDGGAGAPSEAPAGFDAMALDSAGAEMRSEHPPFGAPPTKHGATRTPTSGQAAQQPVEDEVRRAVAWALGSSEADEMQPLVDEVLPTLGSETKAAWVKQWRSAAAQASPPPSRPRRPRTRSNTSKPPGPTCAAPRPSRNRRNRTFFIRDSVQAIAGFRKWAIEAASASGGLRRGAFQRYLDSVGVSKDANTRQHFKRVHTKIREVGWRRALAAAMPRGGKSRQRLLLKQGQHLVKARGLKEALFAWFCQIRGAIAGRLPLDIMYAKAEELRLDFIKEALAKEVKPAVPKFLSTGWMSKFMKSYHISLRRPNKRWKVPRKSLLTRLRTMWCNSIRIRTLCWLAHGYDPHASGFDQKPFHINEAGSKQARTLSFKGQKEVPLKELHTDTRARWTASTMVVSDPAQARMLPHLECLFKGGAGVLRSLEDAVVALAPAGHGNDVGSARPRPRLSVQVSDTGSYRLEHILTYLERALERMPGEEQDWRILYCDVYAPHLGDPVARLAWKHKYVIVVHGGGTTGVAQVNDTHLHQALSREYQRLEQQDMFRMLAREAGKAPTRQRGVCIRDLFLIWQREEIHLAAAQGFLRNMLTNALDGSEDCRASVEVARFWDELHMTDIRKVVIDNVCEEWEAGRLEWSYEVVYGLIESHAKTGHLDEYIEGQEDEGEDAGADAEPWDDGDLEVDESALVAPGSAVELGTLTSAQEKELESHERRIAILDSTMDLATAEFPSLARHARDLRDEVVKQATARTDADAHIARAVRAKERLRAEAALLDRVRAEEAADKRRVHEEAVEATIARFEQRGEEIAMRERQAEEKAARQRVAAATAARKQAIVDADRSFTAGDLGQGRPDGGGERLQRNRLEMLERVFNLGDELPVEMEANLKVWARRFDKRGCEDFNRAWGSTFRDMMSDLLAELRAGNLKACIRFHRHWTRAWSLSWGEVVVPREL